MNEEIKEDKKIENKVEDKLEHKPYKADSKKKVIEALKNNMGIITISCNVAGISRDTFYRWLKEDKEFTEEVEKAKEIERGMVEDKLKKAIAQDNIAAIIFYLKSKHPEYRFRGELDIPKGVDIRITMVEPGKEANEKK